MVHDSVANHPAFRHALLADPRAAVSKLLRLALSDAVRIDVHEETLTHIHLVIAASVACGEIADDDLDQVAGGVCWGNCDDCGP